jgi:Domain of unknown function (DUF4148)
MKVSTLISLLAFPLCASTAAIASEPNPAAPLTRAEVIADLQVWQESGMSELSNGDEPAIFHPHYDQTMTRYLAARSSPAFAALVHRIAQRRGEVLQIAAAR